MSLLNFPPEVTLQIMLKLNLFNRINLSMTHSSIMPLCFDKSLDRKSMGTITVNELRQLYQQSRTEKERDQCFNPNILDRIQTENFNEVVHLHMDPMNDHFFTNHKILHSFKGKIVLDGETEQLREDFRQKFLSLIDKIEEENIFLVFVDVVSLKSFIDINLSFSKGIFENQCEDILSRKLRSGKKVFCINFSNATSLAAFHKMRSRIFFNCEEEMKMNDVEMNSAIYNRSIQFDKVDGYRVHFLALEKINSTSNIEKLIDMINGERFIGRKQDLLSVLPLVKAAEFLSAGRDIICSNCGAEEWSTDRKIFLEINEPAWSNCADCELKR